MPAEGWAAVICVEGEDDYLFVCQLLKHLGVGDLLAKEKHALSKKRQMKNNVEVGRICVCIIGGNETTLFSEDVWPLFEDAFNLSGETLILLDADENPSAKRQTISDFADKADWFDADSVFLLPNNEKQGDLETLLIELSRDDKFRECYDGYLQCLKSAGFRRLGRKDRIHDYCQAVCGKRPRKCDYFAPDSPYWNAESECLRPLKDFLKNRLSLLPAPKGGIR